MHENIKNKRGHWKSFSDIDGLAHNCHSLLEDKEGNIWVGSRGNGLSCYDGKKLINLTTKDGLVSDNISCIYQAEKGDILIGTSSGLSRYDGKIFVSFTLKDGLVDNNVSSVHQDREGNIWIGTWGSGLIRFWGLRSNGTILVDPAKRKKVWRGVV